MAFGICPQEVREEIKKHAYARPAPGPHATRRILGGNRNSRAINAEEMPRFGLATETLKQPDQANPAQSPATELESSNLSFGPNWRNRTDLGDQ